MNLDPYSKTAPLDDANLSDEDDFPKENSDQPEANNVFTDDDNGDKKDDEFDPTPSQSQQKEKLMVADGTGWTMVTTHAKNENLPPLSVIVPQRKSQRTAAASSPVKFFDLYPTSYMLDSIQRL